MVKLSCVFCSKGKFCPMHSSASFFKTKQLKEDFATTSPPTIFIGSKLKYPHVNVGVLAPPEITEDAWLYDAPSYWASYNYPLRQIVQLRTNLVNSRFQTTVKEARKNTKFLSLAQQIGMTLKPTNIEVGLKRKININSTFDTIHLPMGPAAQLKDLQITENPKIPFKVDKVVSDTDLKAVDAINYLYNQEFSEQSLTQLLSIGVLGLKKNRKLVSTRMSITATDDILGKKIIEKIQDYPQLDTYMLFMGSYLGNYYFLLFFPEVFSYELFETYVGYKKENQVMMTDYESHYGRKNYVDQTAGGYFACRLPILQKLEQLKRQASVLALRFITSDYTTPLGVFVCREATRKALQTEQHFATKEELLKATKEQIFKNFGSDAAYILKQSKLLAQINQPKLTQYF